MHILQLTNIYNYFIVEVHVENLTQKVKLKYVGDERINEEQKQLLTE